MSTCHGICDHCFPDITHGCVRPSGHSGYCSCVLQADDEVDDE